MGSEAINLTDEEKASLSEAEIEALEEDQDEGDPKKTGEDAGEDAGKKTGEDAGEADEEDDSEADADKSDKDDEPGEDDKAGDEKGDDKKTGEDDSKKTDKGAEEKPDEDAGGDIAAANDAFVPKYNSALPDDFKEQKEAVEAKFTELDTKYNDGDMSHKQYMVEFRKTMEQKSELDRIHDRAEIMGSQSNQNAEQHWQWEQDRFFREKENLALYKNNMAFDALNGEVKRLVAEEKTSGLSGKQILEIADKNVRALLSPGEEKKPGKKEVPRKPDLEQVPKTLSGMPSASGDADVGGDKKFAYLDDLSGIEYENALAKLSDEDEAIYLKG